MCASGAWKSINAVAKNPPIPGNLARACSNLISVDNCAPVADVIWLTPVGLPFQLDVGTAIDFSVRKKLQPVHLMCLCTYQQPQLLKLYLKVFVPNRERLLQVLGLWSQDDKWH